MAEYGQTDYTADRASDTRLNPNDIISIAVFREPDLSTDKVRIGNDGTVAVPLLGSIKAAGLTPRELADQVASRLKAGYVNDPSVNVNVDSFDSHKVTVEGSVTSPGVFAYSPGARLSDAIALAAGPSRVAKLKEVAIFRTKPDGIYVAKFDYGAVSSGGMMDPVLEPGDRIVVGLSGLSQLWQDFLRTVPLLALFQRF